MTVEKCGKCPALKMDEHPRCSFWLETIRMCWGECEFADNPELLKKAIEDNKKYYKGIL